MPKDTGNKFLIGAATSAYQTEGNNIYTDVWVAENMKNSAYKEKSLGAALHYDKYEEDIERMKNAGLNAYRFSIEWARIEPNEGAFDKRETEHYRKVIECCRKKGIEPVVTLHHFSSPKWLIENGGWESEKTIFFFARYVKYIAENFCDTLNYVCTINEANIGLQIAELSKDYGKDASLQLGIDFAVLKKKAEETKKEYVEVFGTETPAFFLGARTKKGDEIICLAHKAARSELKKKNEKIKVGMTLSLHDIQYENGGEMTAESAWVKEFSHYLPYVADDDFIGVQNYTRTLYGKDGAKVPSKDGRLTDMEYEFYPEALSNVIRRIYMEARLPIFVTENGIATNNDEERIEFIEKALCGVKDCIKDGIPVIGYLHWSLLDNYEWQKGYSMKFGLVGVDGETKERKPKESLYYLGKKAKELFYE